MAAIGTPSARAGVAVSSHATVGGGAAATFTCGSLPLGTCDGSVRAALRPNE
jgi:hypothetical protein